MSTPSVHLAVLVVATDPAKADLGAAMIVRGRANGAGHQIVQQTVTKDAEANIRSNLARWIDDPNIDVVLVIGAVESDTVPSAIRPLVTQRLEGFTDLFRYLAFQELGAGAMLSNAEAAQCGSTFVFVLPGGVGAVGTAMDKLIIPQLDLNTQPKNLVAQMPRLAAAAVEEALVEDGVPASIAPEKTAGGSGLAPKLPANRAKPATARNVIRRAQDDPPTKQIDVAKLERQLESSRSPNDAQTKPAIDLRKMLPKLPPGASIDPDTDVELLAAPPPPLAGTARIDTSPPIPPPRALTPIKGNAFSAKEGTSPGTAAPSSKPLPSLTGMKGNAFDAKEGTSPGAGAPAKPSSGTRSRPISVPPTNAFGKEGTSPGTLVSRDPTGRTNLADPTSRTNAVASDEAPTNTSREGKTQVYARDEAKTNVTREEPTNRVIPLTQDEARTKIFAKEGTSPGSPAPARGTGPSPVAPPPVKIAPTKAGPKEPQRPISSGMLGLPSSKIFANAANEAPKTNGVATSLTPSVEMAPLVEATLEDEDALDEDLDDEALLARAKAAHAAEEAVTVPRKREPTPPPPKVVAQEPQKAPERAQPPSRKWEPTQKVDPMPMAPAMRSSSAELPVGTFQYPVMKKRSGGALKWLLLLFALGAGFGAVVIVVPKLMKSDDKKPGTQVAQNVPAPTPPTPTPPTPPQAGSAATPETPTTTETPETPAPANTPPANTPPANTPPANTPPANTPPTNTPPANTPPANTPTPPANTQTKHGGTQTKRPNPTTTTTPAGTPVTTPDHTPTTTPEDKPIETKPSPPPADPTCDEVSCVLSKYDRPCCERYKPKDSDIAKRSGSVPEDLDRQAVRTGIEKVKPAVVQCGENASVKGTVKIAVTVAPEGNVTAADVADSPDAALGSCVASAIKRASFAKTVNGGSFTYPFVF